MLPPDVSTLQLSNLDAVGASDGLKLIGQRCHVQGSHRFRGLVHACKYTSASAVNGDDLPMDQSGDMFRRQNKSNWLVFVMPLMPMDVKRPAHLPESEQGDVF